MGRESNESSRSLTVGDKLYRVVEYIPDGPDVVEEHASWVVQERTVRTVTAKMMSLDRPFSYCAASHGRVAIDRVLGVEMFASRADAVANFRRRARRRADTARRDLAETDRMVAWAERTIADAQQRAAGVRMEYLVCPKCHCRECADCTCCLEHDERDRDLARAR